MGLKGLGLDEIGLGWTGWVKVLANIWINVKNSNMNIKVMKGYQHGE